MVATRDTEQYVCIDVNGCRPEDSWFHLAAGMQRSIVLYPAPRSGGGSVWCGR